MQLIDTYRQLIDNASGAGAAAVAWRQRVVVELTYIAAAADSGIKLNVPASKFFVLMARASLVDRDVLAAANLAEFALDRRDLVKRKENPHGL